MKFNKKFKTKKDKNIKNQKIKKDVKLVYRLKSKLWTLFKFILGNLLTIFIIYVILRFITAIGVNLLSQTTSNIMKKGIQNTNQAIVDTQSLNYLIVSMCFLVAMQYSKIHNAIKKFFGKMVVKFKKLLKKRKVVIKNEK